MMIEYAEEFEELEEMEEIITPAAGIAWCCN
ncbi:hypothetical protein C8E03_104129 [Lachnotalea glycerini]|uniref:Uncharacterized protein n=1 Tax=Lachnotalea glycerini TaxID=1763509 RepID=A0A318EMG9_9FIRM|nr:hypothetical protein C8E03_104129 [Lachnotalea glycerini]